MYRDHPSIFSNRHFKSNPHFLDTNWKREISDHKDTIIHPTLYPSIKWRNLGVASEVIVRFQKKKKPIIFQDGLRHKEWASVFARLYRKQKLKKRKTNKLSPKKKENGKTNHELVNYYCVWSCWRREINFDKTERKSLNDANDLWLVSSIHIRLGFHAAGWPILPIPIVLKCVLAWRLSSNRDPWGIHQAFLQHWQLAVE